MGVDVKGDTVACSAKLVQPFKEEGRKSLLETSRDFKEEDLIEENARLRLIINDITEVNKRWQKYNQKHQNQVQKLVAEILELRKKLTAEKSENGKVTLKETKSLGGTATDVSSLQERYTRTVQENSRLEEENRTLRKNNREISQQLEAISQPSDTAALQHQVRLHKEDWEAEKQEKHQVQLKLMAAESEVETYKFKCQLYERQLAELKALALSSQNLSLSLHLKDSTDTKYSQRSEASGLFYARKATPSAPEPTKDLDESTELALLQNLCAS